MQRFIQDLGVLTGVEQNDLFFCRNPSSPARADFNTVMDSESLSDRETAQPGQQAGTGIRESHARHTRSLDVHAQDSLAVPDSRRKSSSSTKESIDKSIFKSLKKKVSFDKGQSYNAFEEANEGVSNEPVRQKRSLPRQEIAVDLESPISNKKLSENYLVTVSDVTSTDNKGDQIREKERKFGKSKKSTHDSVEQNGSKSTEKSNFSEKSPKNDVEWRENAISPPENNTIVQTTAHLSANRSKGLTLRIPNYVVKATITENSESSGIGNTELATSVNSGESASDSQRLVKLFRPANEAMTNKLDSQTYGENDGVGIRSGVGSQVFHEEHQSSNSVRETPYSNGSDDDKNKNSDSFKVLLKHEGGTRWSCSGFDDSKETSL